MKTFLGRQSRAYWQGLINGFEILVKNSNEYRVVYKVLKGLIKTLSRRDRFLDVGGGNPNTLSRKIGLLFKETVIIEPNPHYQHLQKMCGHKVIPSRVEEVALFQNTFDCILAAHVFYYVKKRNYESIINKLLHGLRKDGILFIILHSKHSATYRTMARFSKTKPVSIESVEKSLKEKNIPISKVLYKGTIVCGTLFEHKTLYRFLKNETYQEKKTHIPVTFDIPHHHDNSGAILIVKKL